MTLKKKIFHIIDKKGKNKSHWNKTFDIFIISLIFLSITEVILESYRDIEALYNQQFRIFEIFTVLIFTTEYLLKVWTADLKFPKLGKIEARIKFMTSAIGFIDLMAILPFYLPFFFKFDLRFIRVLRVFRLLRIFKLNRYTKAMALVATIFFDKRVELGITLLVTFILLLLSSTIMFHLEHDVQPDQFPNIIETFWWAIATLTTVGYGDVYPITGWGKLISGIIALLGIGLVALPTGIISAAFIEGLEEQKNTEKGFNYCPHCGEKLP